LNPLDPIGDIANRADGIGTPSQRPHSPPALKRRSRNVSADKAGRA